MRRPTRHFDTSRQTATLFRWLVWAAIFVMLGVMLYQTAARQDVGPSLASIPEPLPEAQRPTLPIDAAKLGVVQDDRYFQDAEDDALFHVLDVLRSTPEETIRRASRGNLTWVQLFNQPEVYRGQPVTLVGRVKGAVMHHAAKNEYGIEKYYELCLLPSDEQDQFISVYCLELPENFPLGSNIDEQVVLTGVLFKRWKHVSYIGEKNLELAPLFLARSIDEWMPRSKAVEQPIGTTSAVVMIVVAVVFSIGLALFLHSRTRRSKRSDLPEEITIPENLVEVRPWGEEEVEDTDEEDEKEGE